ncbi:MAG: UDP-N-acetylglucosamine 1-carboxyvinyltransferase [Geobacter sp.]|nr:MAG: UDP-N-acetylglucosamine 1-carboxyvinyltransferase [Geobacter sp.]
MNAKSDDFRYLVRPSRLTGEVSISGAKNSVLRLLAASLLTAERVHLYNYPESLLDAQVHVQMLQTLGKTCTSSSGEIKIDELRVPESKLQWDGRSIRNTLLILGALTARTGEGRVPLPGGCNLGERKYDLHEMLLKRLGAEVWEEEGYLCAHAPQGLVGTDIYLPIRSTGATENAIICATLAKGTTRVWNPHIRPEILDLVRFLCSMGAKIQVFGQEHIEITGVEALRGASYYVLPDNMEALTWLVAAMITGGAIEIHNFPYKDLEVPLIHLRESGARFFRGEGSLIVRGGRCYPLEISTGPYPGINSDMQPLLAVYGAFAKGQSVIVDLRFPGRYGYAEELAKMGVSYKVEGNLLRIDGGSVLHGANVRALDLRAGIALTLAGLGTDGGETLIHDAWQVERGYNMFIKKMQQLGGDVSYA